MQTYLRVKQNDTGHELSLSQTQYDFAPNTFTVLDKPATDAGGNPLAPKYKTSASAEAAKKASPSGQKADPPKENS